MHIPDSSLQMNEIDRIKGLHELETEIKKLKDDNFKLREQINYFHQNNASILPNNVREVLAGCNKSIDQLKNEKQKLEEAHKSTVQRMTSEITKLIKCVEDYNEENTKINEHNRTIMAENAKLSDCIANHRDFVERSKIFSEQILAENAKLKKENERIQILENEIEKRNNEIEIYNKEINLKMGELENEKLKTEKYCNAYSAEIEKYKNFCERLKNENEEIKKKAEEEIQFLKNNEKMKKSFEEGEYKKIKNENENLRVEIKKLKFEINSLKDENDAVLRNLKMKNEEFSGEKESIENFYKSKLRDAYDKEAKMVEELKNYGLLRNELINLKKRISEKIDDAKKIGKFVDKIKKMVFEKLEIAQNEKKILYEDFQKLKKVLSEKEEICAISHKNVVFLQKMNLKSDDSVEKICSTFSKMYSELVSKIEVMDKEIVEMTHFAENNKNLMHSRTMKLVENFSKEFSAAKNELILVRNYLEKKKKEIKAVKKENNEIVTKMKIVENKKNELQCIVDRLKEKYSSTEKELKSKNDVLNRLQMKMETHMS